MKVLIGIILAILCVIVAFAVGPAVLIFIVALVKEILGENGLIYLCFAVVGFFVGMTFGVNLVQKK